MTVANHERITKRPECQVGVSTRNGQYFVNGILSDGRLEKGRLFQPRNLGISGHSTSLQIGEIHPSFCWRSECSSGSSAIRSECAVGQNSLHALSPMQLAGALYLGSGVGLALWRLIQRLRRNAPKTEAALARSDWPLLIGGILSGGWSPPSCLWSA